jgi:hypothetical protein
MTLSIFNPCTGTADEIDIADDGADDAWFKALEARIAEVRALMDDISEIIPAVMGEAQR